jgi:UDP-N-acetylmuramoylalanine--D-glutamate ligase
MLAASLTAQAAGARINDIRKVLKSFKGLPDRQEILKTIRGVTYINDTTATTPDGTMAALRTFTPQFKKIRLIIGGSDKELEFDELAKLLKKQKPDVVVLDGTAHGKLTDALKKQKVVYEDVPNLQEGFKALQARVQKGDALILSPGCASFGFFANEFQRGEVFRELVATLDGKTKIQ